jgi:hypothetical protein
MAVPQVRGPAAAVNCHSGKHDVSIWRLRQTHLLKYYTRAQRFVSGPPCL